jgi:hypothetical protein
MQQSLLLCFFSVDSLPLGDRNFLCPVAAPAPRKPILQNSRRVLGIAAHILRALRECRSGFATHGNAQSISFFAG